MKKSLFIALLSTALLAPNAPALADRDHHDHDYWDHHRQDNDHRDWNQRHGWRHDHDHDSQPSDPSTTDAEEGGTHLADEAE